MLAALAPTDFDRRVALRGYYDADPATEFDPKPTHAHLTLAPLVKRGSVPVILTTNFDRLLELALAKPWIGMTSLLPSGA